MSRPFDYLHFQAVAFAAYVAQDMKALGDALMLMRAATGHPVLAGERTQEEVQTWARETCAKAAVWAAEVETTGDLPEGMQCTNPRCREHGLAARKRIAAQAAQALNQPPTATPDAPPVVWAVVAGEH